MRCRALVLAGLTLLATGCARPASYWQNRVRDLAQCSTVAAGIGLGLDAEIHVTDWVGTGVGASVTAKYGWGIGYPVGDDVSSWPCLERHVGFPIRHLALVCAPRWATPNELPPSGPEFLITDATWRIRRTASVLLVNLASFHRGGGWVSDVRTIDRFGIDVGATLLVPSVRVGFNPAQFLDFLLGWTTLDIAGDDEAGQAPPPPTPQPLQKDATQ